MSSLPISGLLGPVVALNGWTLVMEVWMYAATIPVYNRIKPSSSTTKSQIDAQMPASARWKRDNYNHLFEQPTQFYAIALALAIARGGVDDKLDIALAWSYTGTRILHSMVHSTANPIMLRFSLFAVSSGILAVMTGRLATLVF
ncbi:hypothetical protein N7462_002976 [Penicillium macrosclerotiorum]|uniref:uncharacterized protein n=1 Tax=Penicillium macrosclerotiorum TaxID=303699 RepID=UPI0025494532|nr:uncharacterized protein N7462_002976 [Penicillium macrosclerotiorum]KAJ5688584.1 hypothetical protein N7462_002976 [Penicillium macrosclerotiorum]